MTGWPLGNFRDVIGVAKCSGGGGGAQGVGGADLPDCPTLFFYIHVGA